jgi:hypothetical protein
MFVAAWVLLVGSLLVLLVVGTVIALSARRSEVPGRPGIVIAGRFVGVAYAAVTAVATAITVVVTLTSHAVQVTLPASVSVAPFPWITDFEVEASAVGPAEAQLDVVVEGLGVDARLWLAAGQLTQGAILAILATVFAVLCHRLLDGSPFRPAITRAVSVSAIAIGVGGIAWQVFYATGNGIAARQALEVGGWSAQAPTSEIADYLFTTDTGTGIPEPSLNFTIDFWPLYFALVLAALVFAFRYGERLQRDTEGLV